MSIYPVPMLLNASVCQIAMNDTIVLGQIESDGIGDILTFEIMPVPEPNQCIGSRNVKGVVILLKMSTLLQITASMNPFFSLKKCLDREA
jgi:hypothetical protein